MAFRIFSLPDLQLLPLDLEIVNRPVLAVRPALLSDPDNLGIYEWEADHGDRAVAPSLGQNLAPFIVRHYHNLILSRVIVG